MPVVCQARLSAWSGDAKWYLECLETMTSHDITDMRLSAIRIGWLGPKFCQDSSQFCWIKSRETERKRSKFHLAQFFGFCSSTCKTSGIHFGFVCCAT